MSKKILHLMGDSWSVYNIKFINFLNKYKKLTNGYEHYFIFTKGSDLSLDLPLNIIFLDGVYNEIEKIFIIKKTSEYCDRIIVHGLFDKYYNIVLYLFKNITKKTMWVIWGGDLYEKITPMFIRLIRVFMKKRILNYLFSYIVIVDGDELFLRNNYLTYAKKYVAFYPNPIDFDFYNICSDQKKHTYKRILLGNSASISNNHVEILDLLKMYKNDDFIIYCPLSYGDNEYARYVISYGYNLFGKKFVPLVKFLSPQNYAKFLSVMDVAIMNHETQVAVGTILSMLYLGKKVFLNKEVSTYSWLKNKDVYLYSIEEFVNGSVDMFYFDHKKSNHNKTMIQKYFSDENAILYWSDIFNS